jgi:hypothetical protein
MDQLMDKVVAEAAVKVKVDAEAVEAAARQSHGPVCGVAEGQGHGLAGAVAE